MTYDPFQINATLGANAGMANPFHTPFTALQTPAIGPQTVNPATAWSPGIPQIVAGGQFGHPGISAFPPGIGAFPQTALLQNPLLMGGLQPGVLQNGAQNPFLQQLVAQQLAQHIVAQQLAAQQIAAQQVAAQLGQQTGGYLPFSQIGLQGSPFGQSGFGQTGYGQGGFGQTGYSQSGYGQMAPQSWVGQAGVPGAAQTNPVLLAQLTARAFQAQGLNPTLNPGAGFQF
jgi:hypothetical protein